MGEYKILIRTDKDIGEPTFLYSFLSAFLNHECAAIRPERFALGEPVNRKFSERGIQEAVDIWQKAGIGIVLKRVTKPKYDIDISWRPTKGKDKRVFPWGCSVWFKPQADVKDVITMFMFLLEQFEAEFGRISSEEDIKQKHFVTYKNRIGTVEEYVGMDIIDTLPGIYWKTFMGKRLLEKFGNPDLSKLQDMVSPYRNGFLFEPFESYSDCGTEYAHKQEDKIQQSLGTELFFDKSAYEKKIIT